MTMLYNRKILRNNVWWQGNWACDFCNPGVTNSGNVNGDERRNSIYFKRKTIEHELDKREGIKNSTFSIL